LLINEVRCSEKFDLDIGTPFQYRYHSQTLENKNLFVLQDIKTEKEVRKSNEKLITKRRERAIDRGWTINTTI